MRGTSLIGLLLLSNLEAESCCVTELSGIGREIVDADAIDGLHQITHRGSMEDFLIVYFCHLADERIILVLSAEEFTASPTADVAVEKQLVEGMQTLVVGHSTGFAKDEPEARERSS